MKLLHSQKQTLLHINRTVRLQDWTSVVQLQNAFIKKTVELVNDDK